MDTKVIDRTYDGSFSATLMLVGETYHVSWYIGPENSGEYLTKEDTDAALTYIDKVREMRTAPPELYNGFANYETFVSAWSLGSGEHNGKPIPEFGEASDIEAYAIRCVLEFGSFHGLDMGHLHRVYWVEVFEYLGRVR